MAVPGTSGQVPMDTGAPVKRGASISIDLAGREINDPKRPKIQLNVDHKTKVLKAIIAAYNNFSMKMGLTEDHQNNTTISIHMMSNFITLHNVCRSIVNTGRATNAQTKTSTSNHIINSLSGVWSITNAEAQELGKKSLKEVGLEYKKFDQNDESNWIGTMSPYLNFFGAYGLRVNELRMGHGALPTKRNETSTTQIKIDQYGLSGRHEVLLEGIRFPADAPQNV